MVSGSHPTGLLVVREPLPPNYLRTYGLDLSTSRSSDPRRSSRSYAGGRGSPSPSSSPRAHPPRRLQPATSLSPPRPPWRGHGRAESGVPGPFHLTSPTPRDRSPPHSSPLPHYGTSAPRPRPPASPPRQPP